MSRPTDQHGRDDLELLFLGTGTSAGVPMIGCECAVCTSDDPRDQRSRPSVLISFPDPTAAADHARSRSLEDPDPEAVTLPHDGRRRLLIDAATDLRSQIIRHHVHRLDGVLLTHAHADHIFGIDDLRRFNAVMGRGIDLMGEQNTLDTVRRTFRYIFEAHKNLNRSFVAELNTVAVEPGEPLELFGSRWTPIRLWHGNEPILGFRIDHLGRSIAYCTDVSRIPDQSYPLLEGLDVLVIDALRYTYHPTHLTVEQALREVEKIGPGRAFFTHMAHQISHAELSARLPGHVTLPHDGLSVRVSDGGLELVG